MIEYINNNKQLKQFFNNYNLDINKKNINVLISINEDFKNIMFNDVAKVLYADAPYNRKIPENILKKYENNIPFKFKNRLLFKTSSGTVRMFVRMYENLKQSDDYISKFSRCTYRGDLWKGFHFDMRNIDDEGKVKFKNGKKPVRLIKQLLKWTNKPNAVILDFFAGSGTTGHAVLDLNKEDGGHRNFILCTNNENNICNDVTYVRLKNVIEGYENVIGLGNNLLYFKTEFVNNEGTRDQIYYDLTEKCIPMLCVKEDTYEIIEKNDQYAIYTNKEKNKFTCVYFDTIGNKYEEFIEKVKAIDEKKVLYIFTLGNKIEEPRLAEIKNYTIEAIPQRIYDLYKKLAKMSKEN